MKLNTDSDALSLGIVGSRLLLLLPSLHSQEQESQIALNTQEQILRRSAKGMMEMTPGTSPVN